MAYYHIRLERDRTLNVIIDDVMNVLGIPLGGINVVVHLHRGLTSQVYSLNKLEEKLMQSQGMTSKVAIKVPKRQVLRVEGKKIKVALNMLIQVLEEYRCI